MILDPNDCVLQWFSKFNKDFYQSSVSLTYFNANLLVLIGLRLQRKQFASELIAFADPRRNQHEVNIENTDNQLQPNQKAVAIAIILYTRLHKSSVNLF